MTTYSLPVLLLCYYGVNGFQQTSILEQTNDGAWGNWDYQKYCNTDSFARGFTIKVEANQGGGDDTAANAIRLLCGDSSTATTYEEISLNNEGAWGSWSSNIVCPSGYIVAFDQKYEVSQGGGDDTALNAIKAKCSDGNIIESSNALTGTYTGTFKVCPTASFVCGFTQKVEGSQGGGDDTSLNAVKLFCCAGSSAKQYLSGGSNNLLSWFQANAFCAASYASQLAVINATNYNNDINDIVSVGVSGSSLWIGLNDLRDEGYWEWVAGFDCNGNSCDNLSYWSSGEPNDANGEDCAEIRTDKKLNDGSCSDQKPFVCNVPQGGIVSDYRANLWGCFDSNHRNDNHQGAQMDGFKYCGCPDGYGVTGIYRSETQCDRIGCIEELICAQPTTDTSTASCYNHDVYATFDTAGTVSCDTDYVLTGFLLNSDAACDKIYCIEKLRCCSFSGYKQNGYRINDWYSSFDNIGWSTVWGNQYIKSIYRNNCDTIECIEHVNSVWLRTDAEIRGYEQMLALKFAPILKFDGASSGKGFPCTASQVKGFYDNNVVPQTDVTEADANMYENTDITKSETFFRVIECANGFKIQYRWFYARQHECMSGEGAHFADWEWIIVHVSQNDLPEPGFSVSYFQHGHYYTLSYGQFYREGNHPIVYVGKNAHGNYYDSNTFGGGCGYFYDYRNPSGESNFFRTYNHPMHRLFDLSWSSYNGAWNYDDPNDPGISTDFSMDICSKNTCSSYGCNWESCDDNWELFLGNLNCIGVSLSKPQIDNVDTIPVARIGITNSRFLYILIGIISCLMIISFCGSIYCFCIRNGGKVTENKEYTFDEVVISEEEANLIDEQNGL
eukprot:401275_1